MEGVLSWCHHVTCLLVQYYHQSVKLFQCCSKSITSIGKIILFNYCIAWSIKWTSKLIVLQCSVYCIYIPTLYSVHSMVWISHLYFLDHRPVSRGRIETSTHSTNSTQLYTIHTFRHLLKVCGGGTWMNPLEEWVENVTDGQTVGRMHIVWKC